MPKSEGKLPSYSKNLKIPPDHPRNQTLTESKKKYFFFLLERKEKYLLQHKTNDKFMVFLFFTYC